MDFDDLDAAEETLEKDLLDILEAVEAPEALISALRSEGFTSRVRFLQRFESAQEAEEEIINFLPQTERKAKIRATVRNVWRRCNKDPTAQDARKDADDRRRDKLIERNKLGGVVLHLQCFDSGDTLTLPLAADAKVCEVREILTGYLGVRPNGLRFVDKNAGMETPLNDMVDVPNHVYVGGITSFKRPRKSYDQPAIIIGAGHYGLRMALMLCQENCQNYVHIDRHDRIGGTAWLGHANPTSKVQSELGTYHLDYSDKNDCPVGMPPWPSRDQLTRHFEEVANKWGLVPQMRFSTEAKSFEIVKSGTEQNYTMQLQSCKGYEEDTLTVSSILYFPGNLTVTRRLKYPGEEDFGGYTSYGMFGETDYGLLKGKHVAIIGMGAFGIENIRTCVESLVGKIYLICRKKNMTMPRMISWWLNNSVVPVPGPTMLTAMEKMYNLVGDDPWSFHSVTTNAKRSMVSISQSARFGITDIYFLARYYGKAQIIEGQVKRVSERTLHLDIGQRIQADAIIKTLGFDPDWSGDKFMQANYLSGFWVDGDYRRGVLSDIRSVFASNFGGTSLSPAAITYCYTLLHALWYPSDFYAMMATGMVPKRIADNLPILVLDAKLGTSTTMVVQSSMPFVGERLAVLNGIRRERNLGCHSLEEISKLAEEEWYSYCQLFHDQGDTREFPPYPYSTDVLAKMVADQDREAEEKNAKRK